MRDTITRIFLLLGTIMLLSSCGHHLDYYKETSPTADIQEFFNGEIKAWGMIQDYRKRMNIRFEVDMVGTWEGNTGTLKEKFVYDTGKEQYRTWIITKHPDGSYTGTAEDIIGTATGAQEGSAVNWVYTMDVPVGDTTYRLKFDDWMWAINDNVWLNRSYFKKFGFTVAELTLFMQKQ